MKTTLMTAHDRENPVSGAEVRSVFDVVDLGPFQNNKNNVLAINDVGQRAGVSFNEETGRVEAFLELRGTRMMLGTLGGSFSIARGINNRGEIVGGSLSRGDEDFHGFLYRNGKLHDLNDLLQPDSGWELIQAVAINDNGEIIGIGSNRGADRVVLLKPRAQQKVG
jgi:probable HAF family extracellular repeat protein